MKRTFPIRWSVTLLVAATALGGCSWLHHRDNYYSKAVETKPLEVPPDLDTPTASNELVVPTAGTASDAATPTTVGSAPPSAGSAVLSGNGLHVVDTVEHTWQRVGLALERANVGTISARDETGHSYRVEVSGLRAAPEATPPAEHHWYNRVLHPFGGGNSGDHATSTPVSGNLTVKVVADGDGARVEVEGDSVEAAQRVLETLRARLS